MSELLQQQIAGLRDELSQVSREAGQILSAIETEAAVAEVRHTAVMSALGRLDLIAREPCKNCYALQDQIDDATESELNWKEKYEALLAQYKRNMAVSEWPHLGEE